MTEEFFWICVSVFAFGVLVGCGIGFYTSEKMKETDDDD